MLALPRYDTYGVLRRYAVQPTSMASMAALRMLKLRAVREIGWESLQLYQDGMDPDTLVRIRMSTDKDPDGPGAPACPLFNPDKVKDMSQAERDAIYMKMCRQAGVAVPAKIANKQEPQA